MKETVLYIMSLALCLTACNFENSDLRDDRIEIIEYSFQFPKDFELIQEKGIDSYVGKIRNGNIEFQFDYGYYSNSLDKSVDEYLSDDLWKWNALGRNKLLPEGDVTGITDSMELIGYSSPDSTNYTLQFLYESDTVKCELKIPEKLKNLKIDIDTINGTLYKFVRSENYVGLYAKNLNSFNKSINSYKALSIIATKLSLEETEKCYEILQSCKRIK